MRVILVPVADRPECVHALRAAFGVAARLGADVVGCHIRAHRASAAKLPVLSSEGDWELAIRGRDVEKMSKAASDLFAGLARHSDFPIATRARADGTPVAILQELVGSPQRVMPIVGPMSDLIVVSRPGRKGGKLASMFLMEALLNSSRPVLVLPPKRIRAPARHVAIAWNQSPEAGKAVAMALPLLRAAEAVTIITVGEQRIHGPKSSHLARYLRHHGIKADCVRARSADVAGAITGASRDAGADMILMGAYSRHRLAERLFGGVTDEILRGASLPVMMYHG